MQVIGQLAAVAGVLVSLGATLWWLRRRGIAGVSLGRRSQERPLHCVARLSLGPQHTLHLVKLGEQALLIAASPGGCALVQSVPYAEIDRQREAQ